MAIKEYDLIAIGGGSGGLGATGIARAFGLTSLLIEAKAKNIGGDCLNYGCVPSKALIHISRLAKSAKAAQAFGLQVDGNVNFAAALKHVHDAQARIRAHENVAWLEAQANQDVKVGWAHFVDHNTVVVDGEHFRAKRIVLATGSRPRALNVPGIEGVHGLHTNHTFFEKERPLPQRLLIVGGGAIACELGQAMQRLGSQVTLVNRGKRLLARELPHYSQILEQQFNDEGITMHFEAEVQAFTSASMALVKTPSGSENIVFDEVLVAIGRDASIKDMNLQAAGIETDDRGILKVSDTYRTSNKHVFVVGDAMGREKLSHGAEMHNRDLVFNMLSPLKKRHTLSNFSWVTFTDPEVATFGYTATQLQERGIAFETIQQPFTDDDRAITEGYADLGHLTLYVQKKGLWGAAHLLGGSMIAPGAGELIQELILAKQAGVSLNTIFNKIYPYPVASRINQKAAFTFRQGGMGEGLKRLIRWWWRV